MCRDATKYHPWPVQACGLLEQFLRGGPFPPGNPDAGRSQAGLQIEWIKDQRTIIASQRQPLVAFFLGDQAHAKPRVCTTGIFFYGLFEDRARLIYTLRSQQKIAELACRDQPFGSASMARRWDFSASSVWPRFS